MANTYTLIQAQNLVSNAANVTFSSIPGTYTDLALRMSTRATPVGFLESITLRFNGDTATNYSYTYIINNSSARSTSNDIIQVQGSPGTNFASNIFSNNEVYIPSYTVSKSKPMSTMSVISDNSTTGYRELGAALWRNNAAITSILIDVSGSFVTGSSFYLYGIKNS
jgi:hypothetical protein